MYSKATPDTKWTMFWEVSHLRKLNKETQIPLKNLLLPGTGKLKKYSAAQPFGPLLVVVPEAISKAL
jgi:hypothetical protein